MNIQLDAGVGNRDEDFATCTICGESIDQNETYVERLCAGCADAWARDVEAEW